jgi:hypothetical protein
METRGRKKGCIAWNKGKKGWTSGGSFKKGRIPSKEELAKLSIIRSKQKFSEEYKQWRSKFNKDKGIKPPTMKGSSHYNWKGGITSLYNQIRHCFEYRQWISDCFTRDNFTCQKCLIRGGYLHCHHLKSFAEIVKEYNLKSIEEARNCIEMWNLNNGRTLCRGCHYKIHKENALQKNTIVTS